MIKGLDEDVLAGPLLRTLMQVLLQDADEGVNKVEDVTESADS